MSTDKMRINEMDFEAASLFWPLISILSYPPPQQGFPLEGGVASPLRVTVTLNTNSFVWRHQLIVQVQCSTKMGDMTSNPPISFDFRTPPPPDSPVTKDHQEISTSQRTFKCQPYRSVTFNELLPAWMDSCPLCTLSWRWGGSGAWEWITGWIGDK